MNRMTIPAREVREGDTVIDPERGNCTAYHVMTTGTKAKTTSIRPGVLADPIHMPADQPVTVERGQE